MEEAKNRSDEILALVAEYAATLTGCGAYASRTARSAKRIAEAVGATAEIAMTHTSLIVSVECAGIISTKVARIPQSPISFERNADLCRLSWRAIDKKMPLGEIRSEFEAILAKPKIDPVFVLFYVGFANASFCRLFGGDFLAMAIVFTATLVGFSTKQYMLKKGVNNYLTIMASSFAASICASVSLSFECTSQTALATSPLFLIPGVPLINGVIDILDGYTTTGISRLAKEMLIIACIGVGLFATLALVKGQFL